MADSRLRLAAVAIVALVLGYFIGTWRAGAHMETGRADSKGEGGGTIFAGDWAYGFSSDVSWTDAGNNFHDSGPPDCLPPLSSVEDVRFAWVEVTIEEVTVRPVVWIDCRGLPPSETPREG